MCSIMLIAMGVWGASLVASIHCLITKRGVDRLTWLIASLGLPAIGTILYFAKGISEDEKPSHSFTPVEIPPPPMLSHLLGRRDA